MKKYRLLHIVSGKFIDFEEKELLRYKNHYKGLRLYIRTGCYSCFMSSNRDTCFGWRCGSCPWNYSLQFNDLEYEIIELEE